MGSFQRIGLQLLISFIANVKATAKIKRIRRHSQWMAAVRSVTSERVGAINPK